MSRCTGLVRQEGFTIAFLKTDKEIAARTDLTPGDKLVYAYLLDRIGDNSECWPGLRHIAEGCGISIRGASKCINRLESQGLVSVRHAGRNPHQQTNRYRAHLVPTALELSAHDVGTKFHGSVGTKYTNRDPVKDPIERPTNMFKSPIPKRRKTVTTEQKHLHEQIYEAYPRHVGKGKALEAIAKALQRVHGRPDMPDPSAWLLGRVRAFSGTLAGQAGQFTPHCATWMNQERYDDDDAEWNRTRGEADRGPARIPAKPGKYSKLRILSNKGSAPAPNAAEAADPSKETPGSR